MARRCGPGPHRADALPVAEDPQEPGAQLLAAQARLRNARLRRRGPDSEPGPLERSFAKGVIGEQTFARLLAPFAEEHGLLVAHSIRRAGGGDIDHVVVGPQGVTVIDSKNWSGRVAAERGSLWQRGRNRGAALRGIGEQVGDIRMLLARRGLADVPVTGVLCLVGEDTAAGFRSLRVADGVLVGAPPAVLRLLGGAGHLEAEQMLAIHEAISAGFAPMAPAARHPARGHRSVRPSRAERGHRRRSWRAVLALLVLLATAAALLQASDPGPSPQRPLSRAQLNDALPRMRAAAARHARGPVRGPRVRSRPGAFRLVFTRSPRCVVVIDVSRAPGAVRRCAPPDAASARLEDRPGDDDERGREHEDLHGPADVGGHRSSHPRWESA